MFKPKEKGIDKWFQSIWKLTGKSKATVKLEYSNTIMVMYIYVKYEELKMKISKIVYYADLLKDIQYKRCIFLHEKAKYF